jgi:hypothetical protein
MAATNKGLKQMRYSTINLDTVELCFPELCVVNAFLTDLNWVQASNIYTYYLPHVTVYVQEGTHGFCRAALDDNYSGMRIICGNCASQLRLPSESCFTFEEKLLHRV